MFTMLSILVWYVSMLVLLINVNTAVIFHSGINKVVLN